MRTSPKPELAQHILVGRNPVALDLSSCTGHGFRICWRHLLLIHWRGLNGPKHRTGYEELKKTAGSRQVCLRCPIDQVVKGFATQTCSSSVTRRGGDSG